MDFFPHSFKEKKASSKWGYLIGIPKDSDKSQSSLSKKPVSFLEE